MRQKLISLRIRITEDQNRFLERLSETTNMQKSECIRFCLNMTDSILNTHLNNGSLKDILKRSLEDSTIR